MAAKPNKYPQWGVVLSQDPVKINGTTFQVYNKIEPTQEFKDSGIKPRENLPRAYINYQFDLINDWIEYFDNLYEVGDFYVGKSADTNVDIDAKLGGTWTDHGTDTLAGQTIRLFQRTA